MRTTSSRVAVAAGGSAAASSSAPTRGANSLKRSDNAKARSRDRWSSRKCLTVTCLRRHSCVEEAAWTRRFADPPGRRDGVGSANYVLTSEASGRCSTGPIGTPDATFDLHGQTVSEAAANAERFLRAQAGAARRGGPADHRAGPGAAAGRRSGPGCGPCCGACASAGAVVRGLRPGGLGGKLSGAAALSERRAGPRGVAASRPHASSTRPSTRLTDAVFSPRSVRQVSRSIRPWRTHCIIHWDPCTLRVRPGRSAARWSGASGRADRAADRAGEGDHAGDAVDRRHPEVHRAAELGVGERRAALA